MRYASLGSGSRGNTTVIQSTDSCILIDCGFSLPILEQRLSLLAILPIQLDAIFISHEHQDHTKGLSAWCRQYATPVYLTAGTLSASQLQRQPHWRLISANQTVAIKDLEITAIAINHDAREPVHFVITNNGCKLGILTDLGNITAPVWQNYRNCNALLLEMNHEEGLLQNGRYPAWLKRRIAGEYGHLSNQQAVQFLQHCAFDSLQQVTALHLSQQNNNINQVRQHLLRFSQSSGTAFSIAQQTIITNWHTIARHKAASL